MMGTNLAALLAHLKGLQVAVVMAVKKDQNWAVILVTKWGWSMVVGMVALMALMMGKR